MPIHASPSTQGFSGYRWLFLALLLLAILAAVGIYTRPLTPIDETRYVGVAWEMWLRNDYLVPYKNGMPYDHKPPLLMWMIQAGWALFGAQDWIPRLVMPLASAASLFMTWLLAFKLWPEHTRRLPGTAVIITASSFLWMVYSSMLMFDMLLALFTLMGLHGVLTLAFSSERTRGVLTVGAAIGLGVLAKGPVILLHILPVALLAPWWARKQAWGRYYGLIGLSVLFGAAMALAWAIPAGYSGGEAYRNAIFWGQTANRMVDSFAHKKPIWWYVPLLPVFLFPWFLWLGLWRQMWRYLRHNLDMGGRFCLAWAVPVFIAFSFISGKQPHYLLPIVPAIALLMARALSHGERTRGIWLPVLLTTILGIAMVVPDALHIDTSNMQILHWPGVALALVAVGVIFWSHRQQQPILPLATLSLALACFVQLSVFLPNYNAYDMRPMGQAIAQQQALGYSVAHAAGYHDQYQFAGRMQSPVATPENLAALQQWMLDNPEGRVVVYLDNQKTLRQLQPMVQQRYRTGIVALVDVPKLQAFLKDPQAGQQLRW